MLVVTANCDRDCERKQLTDRSTHANQLLSDDRERQPAATEHSPLSPHMPPLMVTSAS